MLQLLSRVLRTRKYHFLNQIEISKDNLLHNYQYISTISLKIKIAPVLKSNAYGHGLVEVAQVLDQLGAPFFCVDSLHEAYHLYKANIKTSILIMGYVAPENLRVKKLPFSYAVFDFEMLKAISKFQPQAGIHIFVDTGMNREGIALDDLPDFIRETRLLKINVKGIMSHLASAENPNDSITKLQIKKFKKALQISKKSGIHPKWQHLFASKGVMQASYYPRMEKFSNLSRVGMAIYGIDPLGLDPNLKPVLKLTSQIAQIKQVKKGASIGYNETFKARQDMEIAILPIGYNDGVDRRLSNKGYVTVENNLCKIIGKISMNITTIDISKIKNPTIGQKVTIFSDIPENLNSLENAAKICKTTLLDEVTSSALDEVTSSAYELLVHLESSIRKVVV